MKNLVPLITAVLLGLAAVFAVSKTMKKQVVPQEKMRQVLIVSSPIARGEQLLENKIAVKSIPESVAPKNCIDATNQSFVLNQRAKRPISKGDYLFYMDLELDQSKSKSWETDNGEFLSHLPIRCFCGCFSRETTSRL